MKKVLVLICLAIGFTTSIPSYSAVADEVDCVDVIVVADDVDTADALVVSTALTADLNSVAIYSGDLVESIPLYATVVDNLNLDLKGVYNDYDVGTPKDTYYLRTIDSDTYKDLPLLVPLSL